MIEAVRRLMEDRPPVPANRADHAVVRVARCQARTLAETGLR